MEVSLAAIAKLGKAAPVLGRRLRFMRSTSASEASLPKFEREGRDSSACPNSERRPRLPKLGKRSRDSSACPNSEREGRACPNSEREGRDSGTCQIRKEKAAPVQIRKRRPRFEHIGIGMCCCAGPGRCVRSEHHEDRHINPQASERALLRLLRDRCACRDMLHAASRWHRRSSSTVIVRPTHGPATPHVVMVAACSSSAAGSDVYAGVGGGRTTSARFAGPCCEESQARGRQKPPQKSKTTSPR